MIKHKSVHLIALSFAVGSFAFAIGCGSKMEAPTTFERWKDEDGAFSIDYPSDWDTLKPAFDKILTSLGR